MRNMTKFTTNLVKMISSDSGARVTHRTVKECKIDVSDYTNIKKLHIQKIHAKCGQMKKMIR